MAEERIQRRLAAILAADVVGYSRLVEADEAGTVARLKTLQADLIFPMIAKDGGRVVKMMGDGVLVEFGSAVDAVRSALAIQTEMGRGHPDGSDGVQRLFQGHPEDREQATAQCRRHGRTIRRDFADDTVGNKYVVQYAITEPCAVTVDRALQTVVGHRSRRH